MKRRDLILSLSAFSVGPFLRPAFAAAVPRVAIVMGGLKNDGGFNQYAATAGDALERQGRISLRIRESITSAASGEAVLRQFAAAGFDLVIGWGLAMSEPVFKVAADLPGSRFVATGSADILKRATANVETWTFAADQAGYLGGWVAGKSCLSPVAVVDGQLAPFKELQYRYFSLGLRTTNPQVRELKPIFTGNFEDPQLAAQATRAQASLGAKLIVTASEGFSSGVIAAAKAAGVATIGVSASASMDAAAVNLGQVKLDWRPTLEEIVTGLEGGHFGNRSHVSTIANKGLFFGDVGHPTVAPAMPADILQQVNALAADLASGRASLPQPA